MKEFKEKALKELEKIRYEIDYATDRADDIERLLEINEEVCDFLNELACNENLPEEISKKANELFMQV